MQSDLIEALNAYADKNGGGDRAFETPIPGFSFMRSSTEILPRHIIYRPSLCIVAQGEKAVSFGDATLTYGESQALVVNVEIPGLGRVTKASRAKPLIGLVLELDGATMRAVMDDLDAPAASDDDDEIGAGAFVIDLDGALSDCVARLARLLATPGAIPVLYPTIMREISYWLLAGPHGPEISKVVMPKSRTRRLWDAIQSLRNNFAETIRIEDLAARANMSPSSFHQHFKTLTSMTPLQYQKQLRLLRARQLMSDENAHVSDAAYRVGYESASQFSREYTRMFGVPPKRDAMEMKAGAVDRAI
jgi:AraC-like DNA-binding protein